MKPRLSSRIDPLTVPLDADEHAGRKVYEQYSGSTDNAELMSCHVSVVVQGHRPHPPHAHAEEEILVMLAGEIDLILPQLASSDGNRELRLRPGQFVYYPARYPHGLRGASPEPAHYVVFKWLAGCGKPDAQLPFGCFDAGKESLSRFGYLRLLDGPTGCLRKLHSHATHLAPGGGHEPHAHPYEAAVVVLEGEIETLGSRVRPHGLVYYAGGDAHGIRNPGPEPARYVVFEFHGGRDDHAPA